MVLVPDGDLVDGEPLVVAGPVGQQVNGRVLLGAVGVDVADTPVAVDEELVDAVVLGDGVLRLRSEDVGECLLQVLGGHGRVEPDHRLQHPAGENGVVPRLALAASRRNVVAVQRLPLVGSQRLESHLLPLRLSEPRELG